MPCYLRGKIEIRDIDRLQNIANSVGLTINDGTSTYTVFKGTEIVGQLDKNINWSNTSIVIKTMLRDYNISKIKIAAQKKGWKVSGIEQKDDKIIIKIKE
jgi:hypothetical protein